jgi:hypothetical protein
MNKLLTAIAASLLLSVGTAQATSHKESPEMKADCEKQAADKKLAGAAKNSFVKKCAGGGSMAAAKPSAATESCNTQASEKKLAGAAKTSFVKKCVRDAEGGAAPAAAASAAKK